MKPADTSNNAPLPVDLDLVGQRIVKLAELSMLEHLEALMRSQADSLLALVRDIETAQDTTETLIRES